LAERTEEQEQKTMSTRGRRYAEYEKAAVWRTINRGISALVKNGDMEERTARRYIVGYLSKLITEDGFRQVGELRRGQKVMRIVEVDDYPPFKAAS
jgi:hypothetical protein